MKTNEVNDGIIGKRCKCVFTGLMVTGVIESINVNKYSAEVMVRFDEPHSWGNEYTNTIGYTPDCMMNLAHSNIWKS